MTSVNYFTVSRFVADFITGFDDAKEGGGADVCEMGSAAGLLEAGGAGLEAGGADVLEDFATFFATSVTIGPSFVHSLISSKTAYLDS